MKWILDLIKKIIFAFVVLYSFNMIMNALDLFIPLNPFTILTVGILGFPGLFLIVGLIANT